VGTPLSAEKVLFLGHINLIEFSLYALNSKRCQVFIKKRNQNLKIVFVDRDGVINKNRSDYVKSWAEFEFLPGSLDALKLLTLNNYSIVVVTNQSVINRQLVTQGELQGIHEKLVKTVVEHGGNIKDIFFCPHIPEDGCRCRKPEPELIRRAQAKYGLDLAATAMIGDSVKDILCARRAGCGRAILVKTGHGREAVVGCREAGIQVDHVADNLVDAVTWLVGQDL
jgi:D-glycero-D-manno-heptose 1,7-bisphosphate phosphatase